MTNNPGEIYLWEVANRVSGISEQLLDRLSSLKRNVRQKAFHILSQDFWDDARLFQTAPIGFLHNHDTDAALSFIIAAFEQGKQIDFSVFQQVYDATIAELEAYVSYQNQEQIEVISKKLELLFAGVMKQWEYIENDDFLCLLYSEEMREKHHDEALLISQELIKRNHEFGFLFMWQVFQEKWDFQKAMNTFLAGWESFKTQIYLEHIVGVSYKNGDVKTAQKYYQIGREQFPKMGYFIEYSQEVTSWEEFEIFTQKIFPHFSPITTKQLLQSTISFLKKELLEAQQAFQKWKNSDPKLSQQALFDILRSLHSLTLLTQDTQMFLLQIHHLQSIWNSKNPLLHQLLEYFLEEYSQIAVEYESASSDESEDASWDHSKILQNDMLPWNHISFEIHLSSVEKKVSLPTHLYLYIQEQTKTFFSHENQWILTQWIFPFLEELLKEIPEYESKESIQEMWDYAKEYIQKEANIISHFPKKIKEDYALFIQEVDTKFGIFFRRNIQSLAKNFEVPDDFNHPELVLLHGVEFLIAKYITSGLSSEQLSEILEIYNIFKMPLLDTHLNLLWEILCSFEAYESALEVFVYSHSQFQDDQSLYNILKTKCYISEEKFDIFAEKLKEKCEISVEISLYFQAFIEQIEDKSLRVLALGMFHTVFPKSSQDFHKAQNAFQKIAISWNEEWILWLARLFESREDHRGALSAYEIAYQEDPSNPKYLKECLRLAFTLIDKEKVEYFIQKASLFSYRWFETEYFIYLWICKNTFLASDYYISCNHKNIFIDISRFSLMENIYEVATQDSANLLQRYQEKLSAQVVLLLHSDFEFSYQLLFLSTLLALPETYFLEFSSHAFGKIYDEYDGKSIEGLLENIQFFSEAITNNTIDDTEKLPMIRDFYYCMMKLLQKIPGWEKQAQEYMKKLDIPYLEWNFCVLPNELSSTLYH